jgi:hypothetical protein
MDNYTKLLIFADIALKMVMLIWLVVFAVRALDVLIPEYWGVPFPPNVYWALLVGGIGGAYTYALSSFRRRTGPPRGPRQDD